MKTRTPAELEEGMTRVLYEKNWRDVSTHNLIAVCHLLVKRADSLALDHSGRKKLRVVAAELRRRRAPLRGEASGFQPPTAISARFIDEPYVLSSPDFDHRPSTSRLLTLCSDWEGLRAE